MVVTGPHGRVRVKQADPFASGWRTTDWIGAGLVQLAGQHVYASYAALYKSQPWLSAAVNKIARMIARLPLKVYGMADDGQNRTRLRAADHPVAAVLEHPNPGMSPFTLKEWMAADVALYGNFVGRLMAAPNGTVQELWPVPWPRVAIQGDRQPQAYVYHGPNGPIGWDADHTLHLRYWSPENHNSPLRGISPVEPLRRTLLLEDASERWTSALFRNAARPSGVLSTDQKLSREQLNIVRDEVQQIYGGLDNAFKIAIMHGGLTWQPTSMTAVDAALVDLRKLNREEVCAAFDIPPPMLQILDKATFSNVSVQHRMLYMDTLAPWLNLIEDAIHAQIISRNPTYQNIFVEFDLNEVLKGDPSERAAFYAVARRWLTINDIRRKENEPPLVGAQYDAVYIPINEYPLTSGLPPLKPTPPGTGQQGRKSNVADALLDSLQRAELYGASRVGAGLNGFDPTRFARELCQDLGRADDAALMWATAVGQAVEQAIHDADSAHALHLRMSELRTSLLAPTEDPAEEARRLAAAPELQEALSGA